MASGSSWFWVAKDMEFQFQRTDDTSTNQIYQLTFRAEAGFANPNPERTIRLTHLETGTETILKLAGAATLSATLNLKPGTNTVKLAIVGDLPQIVKAPGDLRIHMLRVEEFRLRYLRPAAEDLPKGKTKR